MFNKVTNFVVANPAMSKKIGAGIGAAIALVIGGVYLLSKMEDDPEELMNERLGEFLEDVEPGE